MRETGNGPPGARGVRLGISSRSGRAATRGVGPGARSWTWRLEGCDTPQCAAVGRGPVGPRRGVTWTLYGRIASPSGGWRADQLVASVARIGPEGLRSQWAHRASGTRTSYIVNNLLWQRPGHLSTLALRPSVSTSNSKAKSTSSILRNDWLSTTG